MLVFAVIKHRTHTNTSESSFMFEIFFVRPDKMLRSITKQLSKSFLSDDGKLDFYWFQNRSKSCSSVVHIVPRFKHTTKAVISPSIDSLKLASSV
jgi:hypothetical protein